MKRLPFESQVVLQDVIKDPFSITVFENKLYWTDWNTNTIQYCDKFTGKNWTILHRTSATPLSIHIDHSALKPMVSGRSHFMKLPFSRTIFDFSLGIRAGRIRALSCVC